jgi:peptidoglycan/xylan/chitin deacetylase (PgdA/CDA1 family)
MTLLLRALMYHRIGDPSGENAPLAPDLVSATPDDLALHVAELASRYTPVGADEVIAAVTERRPLPRGAVLFTFDDGYADFAEVAWPILKQRNVPAVLFVCSAFPDSPGRMFWWDQLWQGVSRTDRQRVEVPGLPALPLTTLAERRSASAQLAGWLKGFWPDERAARLDALLTDLRVRPEWTPAVSGWDELRRLASDGVTIAAHSRTHALLNQVDDVTLHDEVVGCRDDLVREMGSSPPLFAYPNGNFDPRLPRVLNEGGFQAAFTTVVGLNHLGRANPAFLRRDDGRTPLKRLRLKLREPIARLRAWQHRLPR